MDSINKNTTNYCAQCGTKVPSDSKFCHKCGEKLILNNDLTNQNIKVEPEIEIEYPELEELLEKLMKHQGFVVIHIGDYFVQLLNDFPNHQIYIEAVSNNYLPSVGNKTNEFKLIGFSISPLSNYHKNVEYADFSANKTIREIKNIFEEIYEIDFSSHKIENGLEMKLIPKSKKVKTTTEYTSTSGSKVSKKPLIYTFSFIILLIIIISLTIMNNNEFTTVDGKVLPVESLVGKNVFDIAYEYSADTPQTLKGTNNYIWVVYYRDIDVTLITEKGTDIVLKATKGKKPR